MSSRKKSGDIPVEPDKIKGYTIPVSNIDDVEPNSLSLIQIVLKNKHGEMWKRNRPVSSVFTKF